MTAILVVDMQNGFMKASNAYLARNINRLLNNCKFDHVFYTQFVNSSSSPFFRLLNYHDMTEGEKTNLAVNVLPAATVWQKETYGLRDEHLSMLQERGISQVYLCGTDIDACLMSIAFQLFDAGIKPVFITDCCDTSSSHFSIKEWSFTLIKRQFGQNCLITPAELAKGTP